MLISGHDDPRYRLLFEHGADGTILASDDLSTFLDANLEACAILGQTREELVAAGPTSVFDPADPRLPLALAELRETGRFRGELSLLRRAETPFPAEVTMAACGEGAVGVAFRDATERKRAEEDPNLNEGQFKALIENSLDWISVCNPDNTFRYLSPSTKATLGYEPEELVGVFVPSLIHPYDLEPAAREARRIVTDPERKPRPIRYRRKDGSWAYLEGVFSNRIDDPNIRGIICNLRDVTERVRLEKALRESEE